MSLDQETINAQLELLAAHRRTLGVYLRQQAELGVLAPPGIVNGIIETQGAIHRIKERLRADGVLVEDEPNDDVQPTAVAAPWRLSPQELRNRRAMLSKGKTIWIEGLLEQSLAKELRIALSLTEQPDAVDLPLNALVQELRRPPRELPADTPIIEVFDQMGGALLILGAPGAGKTTLLLELARDLIARAEQDEGHPIPVVFNLLTWATKRRPLKDWLVEELNTKYDVPRKLAQAWMDADVVLPLLDGLDEVAEDHRATCVEVINTYQQEHGLVPLAVCSRVADYEALTTQLRLQGAIVVQPLTKQQVDTYLERAGEKLAGVRGALRNDTDLRELLNTPLILTVVALAYKDKPLAGLQVGGTPDERRRHLFDTYTAAMFERRSQEMRYPPEQTMRWLAGLAQAMVRQAQPVFFIERLQPEWLPTRAACRRYLLADRLVGGLVAALLTGVIFGLGFGLVGVLGPSLLGGLADALMFGLIVGLFGGAREGLSGVQRGIGQLLRSALLGYLVIGLGGLLASALVLGLGGESVRSAMRSVVVAATAGGLAGELGTERLLDVLLGSTGALIVVVALSNLIGYGAYGALIGALVGPPGVQPRHIAVIETLRWSWPKARQSALGGVVGGLVSGLGIGLVGGLGTAMVVFPVVVPDAGLVVRLVVGLVVGLVGGLVFALAFGLVFGLAFGVGGGLTGGEVEAKAIPNQGIRRSLRSALLSGLVVGVIFGLGNELLFGLLVGLGANLANALFAGLEFGLVGALAYGGYACLSHLALRYVLWGSGALPWSIAGFLDYCAERIFLRRVGGGYIFVHRLLMEHFASLQDGPPIEQNRVTQ